MKRAIAVWFNEQGSSSNDRGSRRRAEFFYRMAMRMDSSWSVPHYNLGLLAKYAGQWEQSRACNQRAVSLDPNDEAAWWNLGIAATALSDWPEARRAWKGCGIKIPDGPDGRMEDEPIIKLQTACVRLNPNDAGEVVWGRRLDPARIMVSNVPLPESKHRFRDIVLNDGAENGTRISNGREVPVFDELEIWKPSHYSTFQVSLKVPSQEAHDGLDVVFAGKDLALEDWSTMRFICAKCSRGNPGPHECKSAGKEQDESVFGFAAHSEDELRDLLETWTARFPQAGYDIELLLAASS